MTTTTTQTTNPNERSESRLESSTHDSWPTASHKSSLQGMTEMPLGHHFFPLPQADAPRREGFKSRRRLPLGFFGSHLPPLSPTLHTPPPPGADPSSSAQPCPWGLSSPRGWPGPAMPSPPAPSLRYHPHFPLLQNLRVVAFLLVPWPSAGIFLDRRADLGVDCVRGDVDLTCLRVPPCDLTRLPGLPITRRLPCSPGSEPSPAPSGD